MDDFSNGQEIYKNDDLIERPLKEGSIASQIKKARKQRNLSQQELADIAGIPKSTVGRIEAGLTSPRENTLLQLSKVLDTPFIIDGTADK
ncbi:helix-turn-helix domain-containing protein [Pseudobacillus badius]|uniref:helix-turn-helix domain-containing protein n=1 Tax=Bacillus badius TaxID=1455 RepID=UPI003D32AD3C